MINVLRNKQGYALIWVLLFFLAASVLSTIVISSVTITMRTTDTQHQSQQAYFTAKSAASAVADYILEHDGNKDVVNQLIVSPGKGGSDAMGTYTVSVTYAGDSKIKVTASATYGGEHSTVSVYLVKPPIPAGIIPTSQVIFLNGSGATGFGQCGINGDVYVEGDFYISAGSMINGVVVAQGKSTITGGSNTTNGLISYGSVLMDGSGTVNGDVYTKGDLKMLGGSLITGNAYADGSLDFLSGGDVRNNVAIGNNASFGGGGNKIKGNFTYGGTLSFSWGNLIDFVPKGGTKISNYTPLDFSKYSAPDLPLVSPPTLTAMPGLYNEVTMTNRVISENGKLTASFLTQLNALPNGSTVTINASSKDIYLLVDNYNLNLSNGINIEVIGSYNVYMFMTGSSSLSINANEYVGMSVRGSNPHLFIIGDGSQSISLNNNSELNAVVYIPGGSLSASGSSLSMTTYKFVGSCIVKSVDITSNVKLQYSAPDTNNTPLDLFNDSQSGYTGWKIESWDNG